ncbi:hypothetical protein F4680DRAFT_445890 [Xylaria scruposa]|nr:hypothetical protein F4680DRAFT_445890 [Xylaria scruposa]
MYLEVLVVFIVVAAALAGPLPAMQEVGIVTTVSGHNAGFFNILSFLGFVPTSLTAKTSIALFKRQTALTDSHENDASFTKNPKITTLVAICIFLEVALVLAMIWGAIYTCVVWRRRRRGSQQNAEEQRAEEVLNHHPRPNDIELGAIHARSALHHSLISNTEMTSTAPNNSEYTEGSYICAEAPAGPDGGIQTSVSKASGTNGRAITKAVVPKICVTDTETQQTSKQETNNSGLGIITSRAHVGRSFLDPSIAHPTCYSTSYRQTGEVTEHNATESSDPQDRFLNSTVFKAANIIH